MKNFNLSILLTITIGIMLPMYNYTAPTNTHQKSLITYLYTHLLPQATTIAAAKNTPKNVIIFDLDGVLCTTNKIRAFQEVGMTTIAQYMLEYFKTPSNLELFAALDKAPALTNYKAYNQGVALPQIMVDWQVGAQPLQDIQDCMVAHILQSGLTISEKNLHVKTVLMMTTPKKYIPTRQIIPDGLALARQLKDLGYRLYILSNWDPSSFSLFVEQFPELFTYQGKDLFNGIMISGQQHMVKPQKEIYQACLKKFNINPSQAIFIDDTIENIQAAQNLGISSIHCYDKNFHHVKKELINITAK